MAKLIDLIVSGKSSFASDINANTIYSTRLYMSGAISTCNTAGSWVSGMTNAAVRYNDNAAISTSSYHPFLSMKAAGGHVVNFGGLNNTIGFYGYYNGRTANSYDWSFTVDSSTGKWSMSKSITSSAFITSGGANTQVVRGDGTLQTISSLSVSHAATAGSADSATNATNATNINVTQHTANDTEYPLVWSNQASTTSTLANQLYKSYSDLTYNPKNKRITANSFKSGLTTSTHLAGNKGTAIINSTAAAGYTMLAKMNSTNGVFTMGMYNAAFNLYYTANTTINAGTNGTTKGATLLDESGNSSFPGNITANGFIKSGSSSQYVLTGDGGHKKWNTSSEANTIVARTADQYIYATYYNSNIGNEDSITLGSVYVRNNSDNWIRRMSYSKFVENMGNSLDSRYVNVTGDKMTGTLTVKTNGTGSYDQGIRINRVGTSNWALLMIGKSGDATSGTGTTTAGDGAWLIGTPASSNSLIFNLNDAKETVGLCLKGHGNTDMKWNNNTVWHAGNDGSGSGLDADLLDGADSTRYLKSLGGSNYITINVGGNADTYYPVVISNVTDYYPMQLVNISRGYAETAPNTWHTSTHRGGLTLTLLWNGSRYWDGNTGGSACYCVYKNETYSTMVGGLGNAVAGKVVWLRGGGAVYHIHSMNGTSTTATVYTSTYTDSASQSFAPKTSPDGVSVRWPGYAQGADYATSAGNADTVDSLHASAFMRATSDGSFYGIQHPGGGTSDWTRTTSNGIIPYKSGGASNLGTSSWPFSTVYANNFYGYLNGNISGSSASVRDVGNGTAITFSYSTGGFTSNPTWLAAWNGYKVTYVSPSVVSVGNADTVDGLHANRFTFVYNSANYNANSGLTLNQMAADGNSNSHVGMIYAGTDNPVSTSGNWLHVWSQSWTRGSTESWCSQIALGVQQGTGMWYRTTSGSLAGRGWYRVIDSGNIGSQSVNYANSAGASSSVTINYNNNSNSTYQMLWGSGNYVYGTSGIYCNPYYDILYAEHHHGISHASSWLDGQRYDNAAFLVSNATDTGSYWPWIRQTNTGASKWYSIGVLSNSLYFIGSTTSRTDNSYDYGFRMDFSNGYLYGNFSGYLSGTAASATTASKLGTNAGSSTNPIYFSGGVPVASTSTVGATNRPVYLSSGSITACTAYAGSSYRPCYMQNGYFYPVSWGIMWVGYLWRYYSSTSWHASATFTGSYYKADGTYFTYSISSVTTNATTGLVTIALSTGCFADAAFATTMEIYNGSYYKPNTGSITGRSAGMGDYWIHCSSSTIYIKKLKQQNGNNDKWADTDMITTTTSDGNKPVTRVYLVIFGHSN